MGKLSILVFLPVAAMLPVLLVPARRSGWLRWIALAACLAQTGLALSLIPAAGSGPWLLVEQAPWLDLSLGSAGSLRVEYLLALDGISLALVLLTSLMMSIAVLASWQQMQRPKAYFLLLLLLDCSLVGVFLAMDFLLFFIFYELMLLPMFFLIGLWGGERREYAAIKFFIYTLAGSVFMLLVLAGVMFSYSAGGAGGETVYTLNLLQITGTGAGGQAAELLSGSVFAPGQTILGLDARLLGFWVLLIAFAIKLPAVPLHTWLPDAHVEAPTPVSVILAGVLLKVGGYGLIRICYGLFPDAGVAMSGWVAGIGVTGMLYGALVAMAQTDLKRMVAYSSVSHMGYVLLGLASLEAAGVYGAVFQLVAHGLVSAMLFLIAGVLYDRVHDRQIANFGGLWELMPRYAFVTLIGFFAALGLPGLCAFVAELLVYLGAFSSERIPVIYPALGVLSIVLGAAYFLRAYRQLFFGVFDPGKTSAWRDKLTDLTPREYLMLIPLALLIFWLGIYPGPALERLEAPVQAWLAWVLG
ncbi:MAG: NADH-quinone oxidoreductase subunit M [Bacteroidia bacterium]|nr:NADH-quinone oxidoreductase subunit M [Bacteroidia bacterium]